MFKVILQGNVSYRPNGLWAKIEVQSISKDDISLIDRQLVLDRLEDLRALAVTHGINRSTFRLRLMREVPGPFPRSILVTYSDYREVRFSSNVSTVERIDAIIKGAELVTTADDRWLVSVFKTDGSLLRTKLFADGSDAAFYSETTLEASEVERCRYYDVIGVYDIQGERRINGALFTSREKALAWFEATGRSPDNFTLVNNTERTDGV